MPALLPILVVNSDLDTLAELTELVSKLAVFDVYTASSGIEAIEILRDTDICCLVNDIELNDLDGWRLARMLRAGIFKCSPKTPIVLAASTWCEHLADATAREFDINALLPLEEMDRLASILADCISNKLDGHYKAKLIVIDQDKANAERIANSLSQRFDVETYHQHEDGLLHWRQKQQQIILLDCPSDETELDHSRHFIAQVLIENPHQPIVVMINEKDTQLAEQLLILGAADFITKPLSPLRLTKICESALRREDFIISNKQFADKVNSLNQREKDYRRIHQQHQSLLNNIPTVVMELDNHGCITYINPAWQQLTQFSIKESLQKPLSDFVCPDYEDNRDLVSDTLEDLLLGVLKQCEMEIKLLHKTGYELWVSASFSTTYREGILTTIAVSLDDITKRKQAELRLVHLALRDTLTDLYNRHYFDNELYRISILAARGEGEHALFYIDLDHFKIINDTQGHHQGDMVLKEVANAIKSRLRGSDILCRIGGDEFAVLLNDTSMSDACKIAQDICEVVQAGHYQFDEHIYPVSCSIGLTRIDGTLEAHDYLKQADIALYVAKDKGRDQIHVYSPEDQGSEEFKHAIEKLQRLQSALSKGDLILHFQPVYDIKQQEIAYYEALVRLMIDNELIYPATFIPVLERAEDMKRLDRKVLIKTIALLAENPELNKVAVNLSAQAFNEDDLLPFIQKTLKDHQVAAERIIFEITESASLNNLAATQRMIATLTRLGCSFAIDDFGTGFSTFAYLKDIPAQCVKIDGSFVRDMERSSIDLTLVKSIKDIANALGKKTVAEFVENEATYQLTKQLGIDYAQGYYISKPEPIEIIVEKAKQGKLRL